MNKRLLGIFALLALVAALVSPAAFAQGAVTLNSIGDKAPGDYVTIAGTAPFSEVSIKVIRPDNTILYVDVVEVSGGSYSKTFKLPGDAAEGVYTVVVGRGEVVASGSFRVTSQAAQDTTAPTVSTTDPADKATNVPVDKTITVTFSEPVQAGTAYNSISVKDITGTTIATTTAISGNTLTIKPKSNLAYSTTYTVTISAGAVKDAAGNELAQAYVFSFTTAAQQGAKVEVTVPENGVLDKFTVPQNASSAVLNQSGAQLEIPQGAFSGAATITFMPVDKTGLPGARSIGQVFEIKIEKVTLAQPVTLRLPAPAGERVRVFKLVGDRWVNLGGTVRDRYVEVSLTSFSTFTAANAPVPPTASPLPGTYTGSVQVTLSAESGATILYGLNAAPQTTYTAPITLTSSTTIRAVAVKDALTSDEVSFAYTVTSPGGGDGGGAVIPYVSATDPADKATGVSVDKEIKVLFNETVTAGDDFAKITLKDASGKAVEVDVHIEGSTLYIKPKAALNYGVTYTVVIPAGAVKNSYGYRLGSDYTFAFTTVSQQPKPPEEQPKPTAPPTKTFADIQGHWAQKDIEVMAGLGIAGGVAPDRFDPNGLVTRAQFAAFLIRSLGIAETKPAARSFKDVSPDAWYYGAVETARAAGLVGGYPDSTFKPNQRITREEIAAMVVRALAKAGKPITVPDPEAVLARFADKASISPWAREAAAQAVEAGIVGGREGNRFAPKENATRAEAVVMLKRMLVNLGRIAE